jgi:hypothetical protein
VRGLRGTAGRVSGCGENWRREDPVLETPRQRARSRGNTLTTGIPRGFGSKE